MTVRELRERRHLRLRKKVRGLGRMGKGLTSHDCCW